MTKNKFSGINVEEEFTLLAEKPIDVMGILLKYLSYWKWFVLSLIFCLVIAVAYIYFSLPKYEVATSIVFKDDQRGGGGTELNVFKEMGVVTRRNNVDNEVEILKKSLIVENVVRELGLFVNYTEMKPFLPIETKGSNEFLSRLPHRKSAVLYGDELPVVLSLTENNLNSIAKPISFDMFIDQSGELTFSGKYEKEKFHETVPYEDRMLRLPFGVLMIRKGKSFPQENMKIHVTISHPQSAANQYLGNLEIELTSKTSSVANVTLVTYNTGLGKDFLREYINAYNEEGIKNQQKLANETSQLIETHLANLSSELSQVEDQTQNYRQSRGLTDIASQADLYNAQLASISQRRMDVESQYRIVSDVLSFVEQTDEHQLIPANSGIHSPVLNDQINRYNNLVLERNRLVGIASSSNQSMINLNSQLQATFNSVVSGLRNEKNNLEIQLRDINTEYSRNNALVRAIPGQERVFSDLKRQQNIKEELFLYLLQKKEERYMNMTTVEPSSTIIDNIQVMGMVWPNKMMILLAAMFLGMILPIAGIKTRDILRYQIDTREDLEEITSIPMLGEIPINEQTHWVAVKENSSDSFNEMIRLLRANLLFVINGKENKVINMLSSISGEGKSFISLNLALSLAFLDKKVIVVELDIRKPKMAKELGLEDRNGITLYLSGALDRSELVKPSGIHPNLSVIIAGVIPPNPNELLAKPALDELIKELRDEFDYIFIDTPPLGMVSDGFLLNRLADVNLYVTRSGYTPKKFIEDADRHFHENRLKKMYLILNSVDINGMDYRYGLGKKYSYGYGYA
ncbi:MAG: polysaccharide biosynthesis tyrosine autokinase [Fermentimonas sp.]|nr:polysaccharide biosynthesis tyrosine autokinase [Fermentimonas sp.]